MQRALFAQWQREHVGHFDNVPDLTGITRPKLDALTAKLIAGLAGALPQFRRCREAVVELNKQKLKTTRFSAEAYAVAFEPLLDLGIGQ